MPVTNAVMKWIIHDWRDDDQNERIIRGLWKIDVILNTDDHTNVLLVLMSEFKLLDVSNVQDIYDIKTFMK